MSLAQLVLLFQQADFAVGFRLEQRDFPRDFCLAIGSFGLHAGLPERDPVFEPVTEPIGQGSAVNVFPLLFFADSRIGIGRGRRKSLGCQCGRRVHRAGHDRNFECGLLRGLRRDVRHFSVAGARRLGKEQVPDVRGLGNGAGFAVPRVPRGELDDVVVGVVGHDPSSARGLTGGHGLAYARARHARHAIRAARVGDVEGPPPGSGGGPSAALLRYPP
ncbi:hypothetical protein ACLIYO_27985 [Streptomyces mangrovi]